MKKNTIKAILLAVLLGFSAPALAHSHTSDGGHAGEDGTGKVKTTTPEERVGFLLSAIHGVPEKKFFDQIPGARDILERIALDFNALQQKAAVVALGYYPSDATFQTYKYLVESPKSSVGVKLEVLSQVGEVFKDKKGLTLLTHYLNDSDPYLRVGAIFGLSSYDTKESFELLKARYQVEKDPMVLSKLKMYTIRIN